MVKTCGDDKWVVVSVGFILSDQSRLIQLRRKNRVDESMATMIQPLIYPLYLLHLFILHYQQKNNHS